jgi:hypothetical protein
MKILKQRLGAGKATPKPAAKAPRAGRAKTRKRRSG